MQQKPEGTDGTYTDEQVLRAQTYALEMTSSQFRPTENLNKLMQKLFKKLGRNISIPGLDDPYLEQ